MSVTFREARDYILKTFKDAWDITGYPAVYTDVPDTVTPSNCVWARVILRHSTGNQASLTGCANGEQRWNNQGIVFVQIFAPVGDGSSAAYDAAQIVVNAFRDAKGSEVWFRKSRINEIGNSGAFEQINVLSDFTYDEIR
jgi:hypothetical protein